MSFWRLVPVEIDGDLEYRSRMPIPERLRFELPSPAVVAELVTLCTQIEAAAIDDAPELDGLLAKWNARASRRYEPEEFRTYYGAMSTQEFVQAALAPRPARVEDLTYAEARDVFEAIARAELPRTEHDYFLDWLEVNFVGANVSDLIYWPNDVEQLTPDQLLTYAMNRSKRTLPNAPAVTLPRADPKT